MMLWKWITLYRSDGFGLGAQQRGKYTSPTTWTKNDFWKVCAVCLLCYVKYRVYVITCLCEHLLWNLYMTDWHVMIYYLEYVNYEDVLWAGMNLYKLVWEWYIEMNYAMNFIISHVHAWIHMHTKALDLRSISPKSFIKRFGF